MGYIENLGSHTPVTILITLGETTYTAQFDARIDNKEEYAVETPTYPIEDDFDTTTSVLTKQLQLTMNLLLTPYPVTWDEPFFGRSIEMVKETITRMYWAHTLVKVITRDDTYENMAIKSLTFKRSAELGNTYEVNIVFAHVDLTATYTEYYEETNADDEGVGETDKPGSPISTGIVNNGQQIVDVDSPDVTYIDSEGRMYYAPPPSIYW